ncbi:MAG: trypsin-like peptidase domain-containing protein [Chloroflexota bacterium]
MRDFIGLMKHVFTLLAGVVLTVLLLPFFQSASSPPVAPTPVPDVVVPVSLSEQEAILGELYERAAPSVVAISYGVRFDDDSIYTPVSTGSGFVIDAEGHIMTNSHVLQISPDIATVIEQQELEIFDERVEVRLFDGTITRAEIIGMDLDSDLAVIKVDVASETLRPIAFGDSDALRIGETVLAIGNPFSNDWTMTSGIISALNRSLPGLDGYSVGGVIQTDTAINPGNSGGPLINLDGEVIGINSQINTENGINSGIGFAVPSNLAAKIANDLITIGAVEYSFIGITRQVVDLNLIEVFDLPNNINGVAVDRTIPNSPAAEAGLRSLGTNNSVDVITAVDGTPIADFDELLGYLALYTSPNDTITLTVFRDNRYIEIPLTLTSRPSVTEVIASEEEQEAEATEEAVETE